MCIVFAWTDIQISLTSYVYASPPISTCLLPLLFCIHVENIKYLQGETNKFAWNAATPVLHSRNNVFISISRLHPLRIVFPACSSSIRVNRVNLLYSRSFIKWLLIILGSSFRDFCLCLVCQSRVCCKNEKGETKAQINSLCSSKHVLSELFKKSSLEFPSVKCFGSGNNNNQAESEIRPSENTRAGRIPTWRRKHTEKTHGKSNSLNFE